jgi:hypothetical protein
MIDHLVPPFRVVFRLPREALGRKRLGEGALESKSRDS